MSEAKISIVFPTKNRPKRVQEMIDSCLSTAQIPNLIEFVIYVDMDDNSLDSIENFPDSVRIIKGYPQWLTSLYNFLATQATGEIIMYGADDILFVTERWDFEVRKAFSDLNFDLGLVFPNDLSVYQGKLATHGFVTRKWIDTFGYLLPPYFPNVFTDRWVTEVAKKLNCLVYLKQVVIEHNQYRQGKSNFDLTYQSRIPGVRIRQPARTYRKLDRERRVDVLIGCFEIGSRISLTRKYLLATLIYLMFKVHFKNEEKIILLSTSNIRLFALVYRRTNKLISHLRHKIVAYIFNRH
jgi:glycosyltransferase involved in cell wall biosynthesis